jgi:uncharacterized protein YecT (DUF1311 family)
MRLLFAAAALALLALVSPAAADEKYDQCVEKGDTDMEWRACGFAWVDRADADLNAAWKELRKASSEETAKLLLDEQRAWIAFKDKACLFWASGEYGTIGSALTYPPCFARVIEARTAELRDYHERLQDY